MEKVWSDSVDAILSRGLPLIALGIENWALRREAALTAIDDIANLGVAILGGDVFLFKEGKIRVSHDSWFCEPKDGEKETAFARRSSEKAKDYIESYPRDEKSVLFAIVPGVRSNG